MTCDPLQLTKSASEDVVDRELTGFVKRPIGHPNFRNVLRPDAEVGTSVGSASVPSVLVFMKCDCALCVVRMRVSAGAGD